MWTIDQIQAMFTYICGNAKTDLKVAQVLSGWPSTDNGGNCPSNECILQEDKDDFKKFDYIVGEIIILNNTPVLSRVITTSWVTP